MGCPQVRCPRAGCSWVGWCFRLDRLRAGRRFLLSRVRAGRPWGRASRAGGGVRRTAGERAIPAASRRPRVAGAPVRRGRRAGPPTRGDRPPARRTCEPSARRRTCRGPAPTWRRPRAPRPPSGSGRVRAGTCCGPPRPARRRGSPAKPSSSRPGPRRGRWPRRARPATGRRRSPVHGPRPRPPAGVHRAVRGRRCGRCRRAAPPGRRGAR